ncbi:MAG: pentapeptide repeat-containing protein [Acidimicrobiaceae bacterium]|nr:pentapeptide repeat-containing protein [Acidimicrobiaceae bacterium]
MGPVAGRVASSLIRLTAVAALVLGTVVGIGASSSAPAFAATGTCSGLSYAGCNLAGVDFTGQNLAGADFTGANLIGANFGGVNLQGANFTGANLQSANLSSANLQSSTMANADLSGANLQNVNLQYVNAPNTNFNNANLNNASLQHGVFTGCTDVNASLTGIHLAQTVDFCNGTPPDVVPTVNCVSKNSDGSFAAYFGYTNSGSVINYPIGSTNSITPASLNGGQPVTFVNGTVSNAFSVTVPSGGTAQWSVNGVSATATSSSMACTDDTLPAAGNGMGLVAALGGAGVLGAFVVRRTARGRLRAGKQARGSA